MTVSLCLAFLRSTSVLTPCVAVADLYMLFTQRLVDSPETVSHGREGYYFAENGEHTHADLAMHLGRTLFELGAVDTAEPLRFITPEQVQAGGMKVRPCPSEHGAMS